MQNHSLAASLAKSMYLSWLDDTHQKALENMTNPNSGSLKKMLKRPPCNVELSISFKTGGSMKYKNAAGLYVSGVSLILAGPLVVFIATTFGARIAFNDPSSDLGGVFLGIGIVGALLGTVGLILLVGAMYRALVKIDALQVMRSSASMESWPADRR